MRRHVPAVKPGRGDPAARIVAVDEVDDLEDVRAVLIAVHHQQVGQRELRVADDVRPDLRQLGLDRRGLHDPRAEHLEQAGHDLAGALADAADDAGQRRDLLEEVPGGDALRAVGDEQLLADLEAPVLGDVARDELGGPRRDRRAQRERVARPQVRDQVVDHGTDAAHVDLDMREGRRTERDDDVVRRSGVLHPVGELQQARRMDAVQQLVGACLLKRHLPGAHGVEAHEIVVDPHHAQAPVRKREREWEADAP